MPTRVHGVAHSTASFSKARNCREKSMGLRPSLHPPDHQPDHRTANPSVNDFEQRINDRPGQEPFGVQGTSSEACCAGFAAERAREYGEIIESAMRLLRCHDTGPKARGFQRVVNGRLLPSQTPPKLRKAEGAGQLRSRSPGGEASDRAVERFAQRLLARI